MRRSILAAALLGCGLTTLVACGPSGSAANDAASTSPARLVASKSPESSLDALRSSSAPVAERLKQAADAGKYLFVFFWKAEDQQTQAMRQVFEAAMKNVGERAEGVTANIADPNQKALVERYGLDRAPLPLVLAFAPNGAITGGFPTQFTEKELLDAFATPCEAKCLKSLQDGKLVLLCIQNSKTKSNQEAMLGVSEFKSDGRYAEAADVVMLDPSDEAEADFLADLQVPAGPETALTVFLAPPGVRIGVFEGPTRKDLLEQALREAGSGCCPGGSCRPGGPPPQ